MSSQSLNVLLNRLIDYAGLFPPAELDMPTAVRNYASYLNDHDAWMLGRMIVPVAKFDEFEQHAADLLPTNANAEPWHISAITAPASKGDALARDLDRIARFNKLHRDKTNGRAVVDAIELKADAADDIESALDQIDDDLFPYFELPVAGDVRGLVATLVGSEAGAKIRTGGVTADLVPDVEHVAAFLAHCAAADVPFKATAGLHHPLRNHDPVAQTMFYGFFNVFIAAVLADQCGYDAEALRAVLIEDSIDAFTFTDDAAAWRDQRITVDQLDACRRGFAVSFGSCSFDEPRDDLRALHLLAAPAGRAG